MYRAQSKCWNELITTGLKWPALTPKRERNVFKDNKPRDTLEGASPPLHLNLTTLSVSVLHTLSQRDKCLLCSEITTPWYPTAGCLTTLLLLRLPLSALSTSSSFTYWYNIISLCILFNCTQTLLASILVGLTKSEHFQNRFAANAKKILYQT